MNHLTCTYYSTDGTCVYNVYLVRKLLQASIRANKTGHFLWIGSDSWGAKMYPVRDQEWAAEGAITILPHRTAIEGTFLLAIIKFSL